VWVPEGKESPRRGRPNEQMNCSLAEERWGKIVQLGYNILNLGAPANALQSTLRPDQSPCSTPGLPVPA